MERKKQFAPERHRRGRWPTSWNPSKRFRSAFYICPTCRDNRASTTNETPPGAEKFIGFSNRILLPGSGAECLLLGFALLWSYAIGNRGGSQWTTNVPGS